MTSLQTRIAAITLCALFWLLVLTAVSYAAITKDGMDHLYANGTVFCMRNPTQCPDDAPPAIATEGQAALVAAAFARLSANTVRQSDQDHFNRPDFWTLITDGRGDCEDFALTWRARLAAQGIPFGAMRLRVTETQGQALHTVLEVRFPDRIEVLDALAYGTYSSDDSPYWPGAVSGWGNVTQWTTE